MPDPQTPDNSAAGTSPLLLSRTDAARILGVSLMTVVRLIDAKDLAVVRIGRRVMIARAELDRFISAGGSAAGPGESPTP